MLAEETDEGVKGDVERAGGPRMLAEEWMGGRGGMGEDEFAERVGSGGVRICGELIQTRIN